jgi:hypothetical protein
MRTKFDSLTSFPPPPPPPHKPLPLQRHVLMERALIVVVGPVDNPTAWITSEQVYRYSCVGFDLYLRSDEVGQNIPSATI